MRVFLLTAFALTAFAFNSILCRWALLDETIDAPSFTFIRLLTGVIALFGIVSIGYKKPRESVTKSPFSGIALFVYAILFSFAYNELTTATGALILFGAVQFTMFGYSLFSKEKPTAFEWIGLVISFSGLVYLVSPGLTAPSPFGAVLMLVSGIAWGVYTLRGKNAEQPLFETTGNFVWAATLGLILFALFFEEIELSWFGILMASISGAVTSGVGYAVWYAVLPSHTSARAAILQLSVPLIAAVGGVFLVGEHVSFRLLISGVLILGGILFAIYARSR